MGMLLHAQVPNSNRCCTNIFSLILCAPTACFRKKIKIINFKLLLFNLCNSSTNFQTFYYCS
jgi:hypothetical protein